MSTLDAGRAKVLVVDDRPENLLAMREVLRELEIELFEATSGNAALALMLEHEFAVVLMDVQMPEMDGLETVRLARGNSRTRHVPIVFVTAGAAHRDNLFRGYEAGAVDYLFKPIEPVILRSKVQVFVELFELQRALTERNRQLEQLSAQLRDAALTDPLTGLHNRRYLGERIEEDIAMARRAAFTSARGGAAQMTSGGMGVAMVDVDHFKQVNDTHGHDVGDVVLVELAQRLQASVRASDCVVRWGGEEFLVLLRDTNPSQVVVVAKRILTAVHAEPFETSAGPLSVTCSVGFTLFPADTKASFDWTDTVSLADQALYVAKERGRDRCLGLHSIRRALLPADRQLVLDDIQAAAEAGLVELDEWS